MLHEAEALNRPLRVVADGQAEQAWTPLLSVDHPGVDVDAVKRADDGSGDLVVRLHEAVGDRAAVALEAGVPLRGAARASIFEEWGDPLPVEGGRVRVALRPFELATVRVRTEGSPQTADGQSLTAKA